MEIIKVTSDLCDEKKKDISEMIYDNLNFCYDFEKYSKKEAILKCKNLKRYIEDNNAISFVSYDKENITGFIWGYPYPDRGDEDRIYVSILQIDENYRGQSIGKELVKSVELEAKKRGFSKIWLHTGGNNHNAIKFYEKVGFSQERVQYVKTI